MTTKTKSKLLGKVSRNRGRPKLASDDTQRLAIVDGARQLFVERGYGRTTTDDVAAQCRISKQTLYRLFPGKAALFAAVVEAHRYSMLALPGDYDALPLEQALAQIFQIDIDPKLDEDRMALLRLVTLETRQHPELEEMMFGALVLKAGDPSARPSSPKRTHIETCISIFLNGVKIHR